MTDPIVLQRIAEARSLLYEARTVLEAGKIYTEPPELDTIADLCTAISDIRDRLGDLTIDKEGR